MAPWQHTDPHPLTRASVICPLCFAGKAAGLVACWPCYRKENLRNCPPEAEAKLDAREAYLKHRETSTTLEPGAPRYSPSTNLKPSELLKPRSRQ